MASEFKMTHRVEFAETDMAGLVHFANYLRYMEVTEHAFLRTLGLSIAMEQKQGVGWPRVHASCDYAAPLRFEDEVEVHLKVREKKEKSLTYDFLFRRVKPEPALDVARGRITTVCVSRDGSGTMKAVPIPEAVARQIDVASS
jgi:YbgC/YbaW family acyl-CoA thioester hydrolase